jgi:hypothetical protein
MAGDSAVHASSSLVSRDRHPPSLAGGVLDKRLRISGAMFAPRVHEMRRRTT